MCSHFDWTVSMKSGMEFSTCGVWLVLRKFWIWDLRLEIPNLSSFKVIVLLCAFEWFILKRLYRRLNMQRGEMTQSIKRCANMRDKVLVFGAWSWAWSYEPVPGSGEVEAVEVWSLLASLSRQSGELWVQESHFLNKQTNKQWKTTEEDIYLWLLCPLIHMCANLHLPKSTHTWTHTHRPMKHSMPSLALFVLELAAQGTVL